MRIEFEADFHNPLKKIPSLICKLCGHQYKPYKNSSSSFMASFLVSWYGPRREPYARCDRCGEFKYKKITETEPKTIKFARHGKLKAPRRKK